MTSLIPVHFVAFSVSALVPGMFAVMFHQLPNTRETADVCTFLVSTPKYSEPVPIIGISNAGSMTLVIFTGL